MAQMESASISKPAYQSATRTDYMTSQASVMGDYEGISGLFYAQLLAECRAFCGIKRRGRSARRGAALYWTLSVEFV